MVNSKQEVSFQLPVLRPHAECCMPSVVHTGRRQMAEGLPLQEPSLLNFNEQLILSILTKFHILWFKFSFIFLNIINIIKTFNSVHTVPQISFKA